MRIVAAWVASGRMGWAMPSALAAVSGSFAGVQGDWLPVSLALAGALLVSLIARRGALGWLVCLAVFCACAASTHQQWQGRLPAASAGMDFQLSGRLETLEVDARRARFDFTVAHCETDAGKACPRFERVKLSWYDAPSLSIGEHWQVRARLREPLGFANPGTFDYDAWLWREGIQALGYVRDDGIRLETADFSLRQAALARLDDVQLSDTARRWLAALTLGAGERLRTEDWDRLNATGTTHLVVISGLHVGLIASLALWLLRGVCRLLQPHAWRMARWPWLAAAVAAFAYAGLAGFGPPALRAAIMAAVGLWAASGHHSPGWWQAWWLALAAVVISDPLAPWRPGVWLSFVAVGVLILAWSGRARPRGARGWCWALIRTQWLLAPIMAAAVLLAFGRLSPLAPLINLVAVPVVGSLMVPLGFLGWPLSAWPDLAALAWWPFAALSEAVFEALGVAERVVPAWSPESAWRWPLAAALLLWGGFWLLPGLHRSTRWAGSLGLVMLVLGLRPQTLPPDALDVTVYDVGQGQLVEVRTRGQRILVDTGPRFASGFMPLSTLWPDGRHFDAVIVTHSDNDHAGGIAALRDDHVVERWWAPPGNTLGLPSRPCVAGQSWRHGDASWRFLSPPAGAEGLSRNDRSCVLLVTLGGRRVLITGDAGAARERAFLPQLPGGGVDVLVAGHHGSAGSSAPAFVAVTRPREVVFSSGRGNAFGHPAAVVVERFLAAGSRVWNTAADGAVRISLTPDAVTVESMRRPGWTRRAAVDASAVGLESRP